MLAKRLTEFFQALFINVHNSDDLSSLNLSSTVHIDDILYFSFYLPMVLLWMFILKNKGSSLASRYPEDYFCGHENAVCRRLI